MFKSANVGRTDHLIRIVAGLILVALPFVTSLAIWANPLMRWAAIIVGVVLIVTAIVRFCPLYRLLGTSTCGVGESD